MRLGRAWSSDRSPVRCDGAFATGEAASGAAAERVHKDGRSGAAVLWTGWRSPGPAAGLCSEGKQRRLMSVPYWRVTRGFDKHRPASGPLDKRRIEQ